MSETYKKCLERMKEISALASVGGLLAWDQETMMPKDGAGARAEQSAALAGVIHEKFVDPEMGDMLRDLAADEKSLTEVERTIIRERLRDYEKSIKLPSDLVKELAHVASAAQSAWKEARKQSDFASFAPWLEKTVELKHRQADAYGYDDHPYDALLDDYEERMTVKELDPVLENLREGLLPIVEKIRTSDVHIDSAILERHYPAAGQEAIGRKLMKTMGVEQMRSRMDKSAHPFCIGISSPTDVRITMRINEHLLPQSLYGVMHESGHALYEQGMDENYIGTPLAESISLGIHESQSRLWENIIGRSRRFITFLLPLLKNHFPEALLDVTEEEFHKAINIVRPSLIRVEADEVTYSLHIVLRYELEKALIEGTMKVNDLPTIWNDRMESYLGIRPTNDADGVLQDTHWPSGLFGYFPTYSLGNLYASQFWSKLVQDVPDTDEMIERGDFAAIRTWLKEHIHRHGRHYSAAELIERVTGAPLSSEHFLKYLMAKYGEIYRINW